MIDKTTICAIATAIGSGAISVIRLSGENAVNICDKIFHSVKSNKVLKDQKANTIHFGTIKEGDDIIDEVLVSLFKAPYSYTGEDSVEISCHGSLYIQQKIVKLLLANGAKMASPGEFTQRAFLNGKLDLSQAEAVADLIASSTKASHSVAVNQMRGGFTNEISLLREKLLKIISLIELELDFGEEDVEFADRKELAKLISVIKEHIEKLIKSFDLGNVIKNGIPVAIVGETNVGKSTLLNKLLNEDKAIVSDIAGTTRDVIEDTMTIEGISFRFIDTAGIRETEDTIESLGIEKTFEKINQASIILLLVDAQHTIESINKKIRDIKLQLLDDSKELFVVVNKIDCNNSFNCEEIEVTNDNDKIVKISAKEDLNITELVDSLVETVNLSSLKNNDVIVTNARHLEALTSANEAVGRVVDGMENNISSDFLAMDIREILHYLGEISGEITNDEILGNIFKNFCIGK